MRKILALVLVSLFAITSLSFAATDYASDNVDIFGKHMGATGTTPGTKIVKIRYGKAGDGLFDDELASGTVVCWDTTSADGYTISACTTSNDPAYAGVLVTTVKTADSTIVRGGGKNVGYMAVEGYCLIKCEANATAGQPIVVSGAIGGNATTIDKAQLVNANALPVVSRDVGVLLRAPATESGLAQAWLK
jgi:hypothetical protein